MRVAEVLAVEPHPNADRLRLATVDAGEGPRTVVCGAPNVAPGQKVAFATEGALLIDGHTGKPAKLKLRAIRGIESAGMVLSEKELGLSDEHEGILTLPEDAPAGAPLTEAIGDVVFDVSTWANRADLLGILGFAREVAAVTGKPLREPDRARTHSARHAAEFVSVTIEAPDLCRRFTASIIEGVEVRPSPPWMQQRLLRAGMRPINNVVDVTNYVMLETGQPLHAFDYDRVRGGEIRPRRARPVERLTTLDGVERDLDPEMLMICDGGGPVAVAGIMGGGNSEVSETTSTVLLEVANFPPRLDPADLHQAEAAQRSLAAVRERHRPRSRALRPGARPAPARAGRGRTPSSRTRRCVPHTPAQPPRHAHGGAHRAGARHPHPARNGARHPRRPRLRRSRRGGCL